MKLDVLVDDDLGLDREAELLVGGVPVPEGLLQEVDRLRLLDRDGRAVPSRTAAFERWADGSIRWLRLEALVDVAASTTATFTLVDDGGEQASCPWPVSVGRDPDAVRLVRGEHVVDLRVGEPPDLVGPVVGHPDGRACPIGPLTRVEVVREGPLVATIRGHARHGCADGHACLDTEIDVTMRADLPGVQVGHRLVNRTEGPVELDSWVVTVPVPGAERAACGHHDTIHTTGSAFRLTADGTGYTRGIFATSRVVAGDPWREASPPDRGRAWEWAELEGRHGGNWVWVGGTDDGTLVVVDDLLQTHPSAIAWADATVSVVLRDDGPHAPLVLSQGMARRRSFHVVTGADPARAGRVAARLGLPLRPRTELLAPHGLVPPMVAVVGSELPGVERHARRDLFDWYLHGQSTGLLDHGDCVTADPFGVRQGFSANNEHDALFALVLHWLRGNERAALTSAAAYADHLVDVDQIHHSTRNAFEQGGLRAHGPGHLKYVPARTDGGMVDTSVDTGHMWVEGLLLYAAVTGDECHRRAAVEVGECLSRLVELGWCRPEPGPRNSGWPLIAFCALYRSTDDPAWLSRAREVAGAAVAAQRPDGRWLMRTGFRDSYCAWQNAILLVGLDRLLEADPDPDPSHVTAHERGARALVDLGRHPDGSFVFMDHHEYRTVAWYGLVREALAGAWRRTKDEAFLLAGLAGGGEWSDRRGRAISNNDIAEWRGHLPFHAALREADLTDRAWGRDQ